MTTRQKIWGGLTLFVIILFTVIMPVHMYDRYPIMYGFLGGILLVITLGQTLGDFNSIYELLEKESEQEEPQPPLRKLAPFAVIPGFIFIFVLILYNGDRKDEELKEYGILTKGVVVNGSSTTSTRRFQKNTSYDLIFSYVDSAGTKYVFEQSVSGGEFNDAYLGQGVDIVYSKKNPSLAEAVLTLSDLAKFRKVADDPILVQQLISILESTKSDTIVNFLNNINYQWTQPEEGVYSNEKRDLAIKVFPGNQELAYMENGTSGLSRGGNEFEKSLETFGFKKKAVSKEGDTQELYYTDKYGVSKETKMLDPEEGVISFRMVTIYHVFLMSGIVENIVEGE